MGMCDSFIKVTQDLIKKLSFEQILERDEISHLLSEGRVSQAQGVKCKQCKVEAELPYLRIT